MSLGHKQAFNGKWCRQGIRILVIQSNCKHNDKRNPYICAKKLKMAFLNITVKNSTFHLKQLVSFSLFVGHGYLLRTKSAKISENIMSKIELKYIFTINIKF